MSVRLLSDTEHLAAECRNAAIEAGAELWAESVRVKTRPLTQSAGDVLSPLQTAFAAGLDDQALIASLLQEMAALRQKLPAPARGGELDIPEDERGLRALAEEAWQIAADALASVDQA